MNPANEVAKHDSMSTPPRGQAREVNGAARVAFATLAIWFIGLGALIGYVLITRGHLWMLPASLIVAAGLLLLDRAETPKAVGPAWAGLFHKYRDGFAV